MRALVDEGRRWMQEKATVGYHAVTWDTRYGGMGLSPLHERAYRGEESRFRGPLIHEAIAITRELIAPTIRAHGTDEQRRAASWPACCRPRRWVPVYSEPGAGSDLAGLATRAVRDGDEWVIDGQKVWTSGAQFAEWGYILCRTDPNVAKHRGITAFLVPMHADGVTVRPLRQMSGGASFNEVFFDGLRIPDSLRMDAEGAGWRVAMTTLGFERSAGSGRPAAWCRARCPASPARAPPRAGGASRSCARSWWGCRAHYRVQALTLQRARAAAARARRRGPEGSIGKLSNDLGNVRMTRVASLLLGAG